MRNLTFTSNVNGLQVTGPADAFPSPHCDSTMCTGVPEASGFACTPQLDPGEGVVTFSVTAEFVAGDGESMPEDVTGANYYGAEWNFGNGPDGLPIGTGAFSFGSTPSYFIVYYTDASPYSAITLSVFDSEGNPLVDDAEMIIDGTGASYGNGSEGFPVLAIGETYCVELTFTPFEEE